MKISDRMGELFPNLWNGSELAKRVTPPLAEEVDGGVQKTAILAEAGAKFPAEIKQWLKGLLKNGDPLSKELLQNLSQILQQGEGTFAQKTNALQTLMKKQIPITLKSFDAVFQALHGPNIDQLLQPILPDVTAIHLREFKGEESVNKLIPAIKVLVSFLQEETRIEAKLLSPMIRSIKEEWDGGKWSPALAQQVQELIQVLEENFTELPAPIVKEKAEQVLSALQQEIGNKPAFEVLSGHFTRVWEHIPAHLKQVGEEFKEIKQQVIKNVERMSQFIQHRLPQAESYVQRVIEPTIDMINKLIQKNEFALFADMEFESDVLKLSGELQRVKGLLEQGNQAEALRTFQKIKADVEKLEWQPSYQKIEHAITKASQEGTPLRNPLSSYVQDFQKETLTGRGVQEVVRQMGLTHERETVDYLLRKESDSSRATMELFDREPKNVKSMLLLQAEQDPSPRVRQATEQTISHLTGQQLLSKLEPGANNQQTLFLQLPVPWEQGMQSVKLEIHSRSKGEKVDWENCQLFFFLDTPRFGETGISVRVTNREVALKIQNDQAGVEEAFSPYVPQMREKLLEMGYRIQDVQFEKVSKGAETKHEALSKPAPKFSAQKGLDFTV